MTITLWRLGLRLAFGSLLRYQDNLDKIMAVVESENWHNLEQNEKLIGKLDLNFETEFLGMFHETPV